MGRRRDRQRHAAKTSSPPGGARSKSAGARAPVPPLALGAAALLVLICALWNAQPGTAYPARVPHDWLVGGIVVGVCAAALALMPLDAARRFPASCLRLLSAPSAVTFAVVIGLVTTGLSLAFAFYAFQRSSSTADEMAQLWHAKMLVHGRLALPHDPNPEFFAIDNMVDAGRWYSEYPIGGPAVLAIGMLFGAPWLINPILAGIATVAMYRFARRAYGETEGRAIAALFAVTPMILMMSGTYMNHTPVLCLATCTLAALAEWTHAAPGRRAVLWAAFIGLGVGAMATIRPLDAVVVAFVVGVFQLTVIRWDRSRAREIGAVIAGGLVGVAPLLYANWATTGSASRFGYEALWGPDHRIGFHPDPMGGVHTLARGYQYAIMYVSELNVFAMLWPIPALFVAVAGLVTMQRATRWDALLLGLFAAQVLAYAAYWHQGQFLGPRFLFTALPTVVVLLARAPFLIGNRFGAFWRRFSLLVVLTSIVGTWAAPSWDHSVWGMARVSRNARRPFKVDDARVVRDAGVHGALVFLRETLSTRLLHRLWGLGMPRNEAAALIRRSDTCSLLSAVRAAEADSIPSTPGERDAIAAAAQPFVRGNGNLRTSDASLQITSQASLTDACRAEISDDARLGGAPFGPALPLEPIGPDGRIDNGDVIFAADLGERNELLRTRFGNRKWYRLTIVRNGDPSLQPVLTPYER